MTGKLFFLWLAAFPLMGSPGPATISLAGIGTAFGFKKGLRFLLGIVLGTTGVLVLIATGVTGLLLAKPALVTALTLLAAFYILYLAWKIATAPVVRSGLSDGQAPSLASGFALAMANPKAFAAIGAVYSSHSLVEDSLVTDSLFKILALLVVIVTVNTAWLAFGSTFSNLLSSPRSGRLANVVFALMLVVSVLLALSTI